MSSSAINQGVLSAKISNVQNVGDSSAVCSTTGDWSFKNATATATNVFISNAGNVGINATSPTSRLTIGTGTFTAAAAQTTGMYTNGANGLVVLTDAMSVNSRTGTNFLNIDSSGNVGVGTTSPINPTAGRANLTLNGTSSSILYLGVAGVSRGYFYSDLTHSELDSPGYLQFNTNGAERMRVDTSGNILVNATSTALPPTSTADIFAGGLVVNPTRRTSANAASAYWEASTGIFYRSTSSLKYKTDVQDCNKGLSEVLSMRPVSFKPKEGPNTDKRFVGFIAEEIDALGLTELVEYDQNQKPDSLAYSQITAILTKAIQELSAKVEEQSLRLEAQAAEIEALKASAVPAPSEGA